MKTKAGIYGALFAALLMCVFAAVHAQDYGRDDHRDGGRYDDYGRDWDRSSALSAGAFVARAAQGGMTELAVSRMASQRSQNSRVRRFAADLITDHAAANQELKRLANRRGWDVPNQMNSDQRETVRYLRNLNRSRFDREYMATMVHDHDQTVAMFERYAQSGSDRELRMLAARTLPTLREHQHMAYSVAETVGARIATRTSS